MASNERKSQPGEIEGKNTENTATPRNDLTPEAERALAEAAERRRQREAEAQKPAEEFGGPKGAEPVRYGDWEKGGIAWDF